MDPRSDDTNQQITASESVMPASPSIKQPKQSNKKWILWGGIVLFIFITGIAMFFVSKKAEKQTLQQKITAKKQESLIARADLFDGPEKFNIHISPDGTKISFIAGVDHANTLFVGPINDIAKAKPIKETTHVADYMWSYTNNQIIFSLNDENKTNTNFYLYDLTTGTSKNVMPEKGYDGEFYNVSPKAPNTIVVSLYPVDKDYYDVDKDYYDLYQINLSTSEKMKLTQNPGDYNYVMDDTQNLRFAHHQTAEGEEWLQLQDNGDKKVFTTVPFEDIDTTGDAGMGPSGNTFYWLDSRGRDTSALYSLDLNSEGKQLLAEDSKSDVMDVVTDPQTSALQAVSFYYDRKTWKVIDPAVQEDFAYLQKVTNGDLSIIDRSSNDASWIVGYEFDNTPEKYYWYDRKQKKATFLFTDSAVMATKKLAHTKSVIIPARDGLQLQSYLTLPIDADKPFPMVLVVHGGPQVRDYWSYNPQTQWLANRGYAVLDVNFRGSSGFGKKFLNAGNREWGGKMQDDLTDAVQWAIKQGIADPKKIAIMGRSYGGYAALMGLIQTSDVYAAVIDFAGVTDLPSFLGDSGKDKYQVGDNTTPEGKEALGNRSPITFPDKITKPVLIAHGGNDTTVPISQSDDMVHALQGANAPVSYVVYPDEGHELYYADDRISFYTFAEKLLSNNLGGRFEPEGEDLKYGNMKIVAQP